MNRRCPIKRTTDLPRPCGTMPGFCHRSGRNFSRSRRGLPSFDAGARRTRPSRKFYVPPIGQSRTRLSRGFAAALKATALQSVPFTWAWNAGRPGAVDTPPVASLARVCGVAKAYRLHVAVRGCALLATDSQDRLAVVKSIGYCVSDQRPNTLQNRRCEHERDS